MGGFQVERPRRLRGAAAWRWAAALSALAWSLGASADRAAFFAPHEGLPEGGPEALAALYYAAAEIPGVASLPAARKRALLDVVTERHKSRLVDRAGLPAELLAGHVERLSRSGLASGRPLVLAQACAQHGLLGGVCAAHAGYVRRALLLEEMLATGRVSLGGLEEELVGSARPSLGARREAMR